MEYTANLIHVPTYGIEDETLPPVALARELPMPTCELTTQPAPLSYQALKIARAISGMSEVRLLRTMSDGKPTGFALQIAQLSPYSQSRKALVVGDNHEPMTEAEALQVFAAIVEQQYPNCKLRNGKIVPAHLSLL